MSSAAKLAQLKRMHTYLFTNTEIKAYNSAYGALIITILYIHSIIGNKK